MAWIPAGRVTGLQADMTDLKTYRFLTGPDDASFCQKVSDALGEGYILYGSPVLTSHKGELVCGQAVILPGSGRGDAASKEGQNHD